MAGSRDAPTAGRSTSQAEPSAMRGADSGDYLDTLSRDDCIRLLGLRAVGRIGATVRALPAVFPVNYVVRDDEILFVTRSGGELDAATRDTVVAFEVDDLDTFAHEGWSVLVVGYCRPVSDPSELDELRRAHLTPWAGGDRTCYRLIPMDVVTGRRIRHDRPVTIHSRIHGRLRT